jgi:ATP-dependent RNA helicase RhlE
MQKNNNFERRGKRPQRSFRRKNRHPGLAENQSRRRLETPKNELPEGLAKTVFGSLNPLLQHAVVAKGFSEPTPIQEQSLPSLLEGRDIFGCAQTGTGKTAAFLLPILDKFLADGKKPQPHRPRALIVAPTRELAAQIAENTVSLARYTRISFAVVFGGVSQYPQVKALQNGADIVVATPGRLIDLMEQGYIVLDNIECFVLDEADRLLDMGFMPDIERIQSALPAERQTMFFSATMSKEVLKLAEKMVADPVHVDVTPQVPTVDKINQSLMIVDKSNRTNLLIWLLKNHPEMRRVIVFMRMRHATDKVVDKLKKEGVLAQAIHSDKTQRMRTNTLNGFRTGAVRVLIATDIASRGIDVDDITHVVNYDLPEDAESYVHRIGRTARAGSDGAAISFVCKGQNKTLNAIRKFIRRDVPIETEHPYHLGDERLTEADQADRSSSSQGRKRRFRKNSSRSGKPRGAVRPDRTRRVSTR